MGSHWPREEVWLTGNVMQVVGFYEFYEGLQEGWDGPALLVFSDGEHVGARLDRNGLRPARFWVTSDDMVYVASEVALCPCMLLSGHMQLKATLPLYAAFSAVHQQHTQYCYCTCTSFRTQKIMAGIDTGYRQNSAGAIKLTGM